MFELSPLETFLIVAVVTVAACIQGSIGFGWAMIAAPVAVLIEPDFVPGPMILSGLLLTVLLTYRERNNIDLEGVRWMGLGSVGGIVISSVILIFISSNGFTILFSILVLMAVALSAIGLSVMLTKRNLFVAGMLSGFMGTASSIGGPPVALIYQHATGPKLRGTLSAFFLTLGILALFALLAVGWLEGDDLPLALILLPGLIIGYASSRFTTGILDRYSMRPAVLILSAAAAIAVLVRAVI